jgi:hypothetical protein
MEHPTPASTASAPPLHTNPDQNGSDLKGSTQNPPDVIEEDDIYLTQPSETYSPEEYRWVPVRRKPRMDGWTEEKQRRFIETLADTGLVSAAVRAVGMTRESAYKLRRAAHAEAFARAWDAARHHAGSCLEDLAFERAIEGTAHNVYDERGDVVCTKRVYNDRLLTFLLSHLKPERYAKAALSRPEASATTAPVTVEAVLRELEPKLPAPPEEMLDAEIGETDLVVADISDGELPGFLSEQRPIKTEAQLKADAIAAQDARGAAIDARVEAEPPGNKTILSRLSREEFHDWCVYIDPTARTERTKKRYR